MKIVLANLANEGTIISYIEVENHTPLWRQNVEFASGRLAEGTWS